MVGKDHGVPPRTPRRPSEQVADDLRRRIAAGEWQPDQQLPSVADLAAHYQVSPSTISRAVRALVAERLLISVPRWGIFRAGDS
jgi:DNA-binding GntR family transcriptional regulator